MPSKGTMKLSPLDIEHQEFDAAISGFSKKQVREFLSRVADAYEQSLRENQQLREELTKRDLRIEDLQGSEVELKRAVIAAERIANEIRSNAKREAELIIEEAEQTKNKILREADTRLKQSSAELARIEREQRLFREQFRGMLKAYERSLESFTENKKTEASALLEDKS
jgi:cell division initiation protein